MPVKLCVLITIGIYVFITLFVYFVVCLIKKDCDDEDNIGLSFCWPLLLIIGIIYAPFWVVRKSAECVRRGMEKHTEEDSDE